MEPKLLLNLLKKYQGATRNKLEEIYETYYGREYMFQSELKTLPKENYEARYEEIVKETFDGRVYDLEALAKEVDVKDLNMLIVHAIGSAAIDTIERKLCLRLN